jgi:O-antigen/teichoic acid export membrane protein
MDSLIAEKRGRRRIALTGALPRSALWALAGTSTGRAMSFVVAVVLARILGGVGYGEISAVQATVLMFGSFASFGLGLTATRFVAAFGVTDRARAGHLIGLSTLVSGSVALVLSSALAFVGPWLARTTLGAEGLGGVMRIGGALVFLGAINGAQTGVLAGLNAFRPMSKVVAVSSLVSLATTVAGAEAAGVAGALWGMVAGLAVNATLSLRVVRSEARKLGVSIAYRGCYREWRVLTSFSLPTAIAEVMVGPVAWLCAAMLLNQQGGYAEFGVYSAVMRVKLLPEFLLGSLTLPVLPALTARLGVNDDAGFGRTLRVAHALSFAVMVPFAFLLTILPSGALVPFGQSFLGHDAIVRWLMLQAVLVGLFQPMGSVLASTNKMWLSLVYNVSWALLFVGFSSVLVPRWLGAGLAAAFALSHLVTSVPAYALIRRFSGPLMSGLPTGKLAIVALPMFAVCAAAPSLVSPCISGVLGGVVVLVSIWLGFLSARRAFTDGALRSEGASAEQG